MVLGTRQIRAVAVISLAMFAVIAVSIPYLRPPAPRSSAQSPIPAVVGPTESMPAQHLNFTGRTDGGYFVWRQPGAGSGGHS